MEMLQDQHSVCSAQLDTIAWQVRQFCLVYLLMKFNVSVIFGALSYLPMDLQKLLCDRALVGAETFLDTICPPGRYCPPGTNHADEYLCPSSTYYNLTGAKEEADCMPCPGG